MPSKPPGVLSFVTQREAGVYGVGRPPGPAGNAGPLTRAELDRRGALLAREVGDAFGWTHTRRAAWYLLGSHSFSAGVSYGLFENLALSVAGAADMLKTFALAEWWASRYGGTGAARIRAQISMATIPVVGPTLVAASMLSRPFALEHKAREAYEEREAIMEAVGHVFTHPKDFLGKLVDSQVARFREFKACMAEESLAGSFQAGKLLGELLFDVLMAIDLVGGLAKLALAVPRVARFTEKLAKLAGELRTAKRLEKAAAKDAELLDPPPKTPGRQNGPSGGSGRPAGGERPPAPAPAGAPSNDSPVVLAGHGGHITENGNVTVPKNTTFTVYAEHGATISDPLGNAVERGQIPNRVFARTYRAGDTLPNYTLYPGPDLNIEVGSTTVARPTLLSDILQPNMGEVHWAACTSADGLPTSSWMYDIDGVIDTANINPDYWSWITIYPN